MQETENLGLFSILWIRLQQKKKKKKKKKKVHVDVHPERGNLCTLLSILSVSLHPCKKRKIYIILHISLGL